MRLTARDQEGFYHLIYLLNEAGLDGMPVGGNELVVPDDAYISDGDIRADMERVLLPGTPMIASGPPGGSVPEPLSAPDAVGVMSGPAQAEAPTLERPPRTGPGSGADRQREYAEYLGLTVPADFGRDQIIALIDEHEDAREAPSDG